MPCPGPGGGGGGLQEARCVDGSFTAGAHGWNIDGMVPAGWWWGFGG